MQEYDLDVESAGHALGLFELIVELIDNLLVC